MTKRTIVLVGGGTGGHVLPVLEVAQALLDADPSVHLVYIGQIGGPERELVETTTLYRRHEREKVEEIKLRFIGIAAEKLRRYWHWRIFVLPFAVLAGAVQAFAHLRELRPVAVFCKGGYVEVPVAVSAWLLRIPIVLHETDINMGLANRLIAPFARRIATSFPRPTLIPGQTSGKFVYTGQPVQRAFFRKQERAHVRPSLLITGGSQGAHALNMLIGALVPRLIERYHVVHLTGHADIGAMKSVTDNRHYEPIAFTREMPTLLAQADLVISRAGGFIFELAAAEKPAILIPLLSSANNYHQVANAQFLADHKAAVVLDQRSITEDLLLQTINELIRDSKRRTDLAQAIKAFAQPSAAKRIAELVLEQARS